MLKYTLRWLLGYFSGMNKERIEKLVLANVGSSIRIAREQSGMSQTRLAKLTGIGRVTIILIEQGKVNASITNYCLIATALGLPFTLLGKEPQADIWNELMTSAEPTPEQHKTNMAIAERVQELRNSNGMNRVEATTQAKEELQPVITAEMKENIESINKSYIKIDKMMREANLEINSDDLI